MKRSILGTVIVGTVIVATGLAACSDGAARPPPAPKVSPPAPAAPAAPRDPSPSDVLDDESPFAAAGAPDEPPAQPCSARDQAAALAMAQRLRKVDYPYHLQAVAVSPSFASGCRALIIAEPPPQFSLAQLQAVSPRLLATTAINEHRIGYDGWTKDVVVTLPRVSRHELAELVAALHMAMFGTAYGVQALDTSVRPPQHDPATAPLDLAVGPGELQHWLVDENLTFTPLRSDNAIGFRDLLESSEPGVYIDRAGELVAWIIPRNANIADMAGVFRQFTVASDLIVGAIASQTAVAVIARRRLADVRVVQPLRFETISLLAAVGKDELHQSYERNHFLAGRLEGKRDWAPILLSPELRDTEYGSLLDITDQFLKSWSNCGTTHYINFPYPAPRTPWPFPRPAYWESPSGNIVYNWNTDNAGAAVQVDALDIFWLRRTSALNVSYFPYDGDAPAGHDGSNQSMHGVEERAYQFFTRTQTPMLVSVVQYNALYQIFTRFNLKASLQVSGVNQARAQTYLQEAVLATLMRLRSDHAARLPGVGDDILVELKLGAASNQLRSLDDAGVNELATVLGAPRDVTSYARRLGPALRALVQLHGLIRLAEPGVARNYASHVAVRPDSWIHTPSIVISWNEGKDVQNGIGGHNLRAKIASLKVDRVATDPGATQQAAGRAIEAVGPHELDRLMLGPRGTTLADAPVRRVARHALGIPRSRPIEPAHPAPAVPGGGAVRIARVGDGYRMVAENGTNYEATTMPEVVDMLGARRGVKDQTLHIEFEGFTPDEARGVMRSAGVRSKAQSAGVLKGSPEFATRRFDFAGARVRAPQIRSFADGAGEIGIAVEVPMQDRPSLWVRIKLAFRKASPEWLNSAAAKVQRLVDSAFAKFAGKPGTARDIGVELHHQLQVLLPECDQCEVKLGQEMSGITIVQRDVEYGRGASSRAG